MSPSPTAKEASAAAAKTTTTTSSNKKCTKCLKRMAREGCTQSACLLCCDDVDGCESHKKPRAQALWKEKLISGMTDVQRLASEKRKMKIQPGRFREPGFLYEGDTVVIWDIREYSRNPKWKEDALRKAVRRNKMSKENSPDHIRINRKRFHAVLQERYLLSLAES